MSDDALRKDLREILWRRKLTPHEEARMRQLLAGDPEGQADWQADQLLTAGFEDLPQPAVPSNFTSLVLQAIEREQRTAARHHGTTSHFWTWRWLPKAAVVAVVLSAGLVSYEQITTSQHRARVIQSVRAVSDVTVVPSPEVLENFDDILAMDRSVSPDEELLKALQ